MAERKKAAAPRWREAEARVMQLEAALYAIMRVTDPGDLRSPASRVDWETVYPARRIAREALGIPLTGHPLFPKSEWRGEAGESGAGHPTD